MKTEQDKAALKALEDLAADQDKNAPIREREEAKAKAKAELDALPPLIPLGTIGNESHAYLTKQHKKIVILKPQQHNTAGLESRAPVEDWARWLYPNDSPDAKIKELGEPAIYKQARKQLYHLSNAQCYSPSSVRKLGFWQDAEQKGGLVFFDGATCWAQSCDSLNHEAVNAVRGQLVYGNESGDGELKKLPSPHSTPLSMEEGELVRELFHARPWVHDGDAELFIGGSIAGVYGAALDTRPMTWVNAPSGSGKSWLLKDLRKAFDGCFKKGGSTQSTLASLRIMFAGQSLPYMPDEFEIASKRKDKQGSADEKLELMRMSYEGGEPITKCDADKGVIETVCRSAFIMFAIRNPLENPEDFSRCVPLRLKGEGIISEQETKAIWARQEQGRALIENPETPRKILKRMMNEYTSGHLHANIAAIKKTLSESHYFDKVGQSVRRMNNIAIFLACAHVLKGGLMSKDELADCLPIAKTQAALAQEQDGAVERTLETFLNKHAGVPQKAWTVQMLVENAYLIEYVDEGSFYGSDKQAVEDGMRKNGLQYRPYIYQRSKKHVQPWEEEAEGKIYLVSLATGHALKKFSDEPNPNVQQLFEIGEVGSMNELGIILKDATAPDDGTNTKQKGGKSRKGDCLFIPLSLVLSPEFIEKYAIKLE